jgi:SWI/SNF-related matrix-associated actin-dependent regulator of chromatin subfamily A-like protein 1
MIPKPHQLEGAKFLAERKYALLADEPRVGKTGASVIASDYIGAQSILIVTTASGRGVWKAGFPAWSAYDRSLQLLMGGAKLSTKTDVAVIGWGSISRPEYASQILARRWDLIIPDEVHYAKNFEAARTQALYGRYSDEGVNTSRAIFERCERGWALSGTALPNSPADAFPMLKMMFPERLTTQYGETDVSTYDAFVRRYERRRPMKIGRGFYAKTIMVFVEGINLDELNRRVDGIYLKRTQKDVGILEPEHELMPLISPKSLPVELRDVKHAATILEAAQSGDGKRLEIHMGPLRRIIGMLKAELVADAVKEELDGGLQKIVLAYWHTDVGALLAASLAKYGVTGIDGSTPGKVRDANVKKFHDDPKCRVFLGQIEAAGEAVDLSAAHNLIFVEVAFTPKSMKQMSLRVTNHGQKRQPLCRVATLEGTVDDALQGILMRKWTAIRQVLK